MFDDGETLAFAGVCALLATLISIGQILAHLRNYTEPVFQRYIIRLIFMVPVYAIASWCSLYSRHSAIYFDTIRDCYEAWIIYNFSALLLAYVGGPGAVVIKAEGTVVHPSWSHLTCCLPRMQVDGFFLRRCKQGTLQFVLMKPLLAALTLLLYAAGDYTDGDMSPTNGYFYLSIVYNVCYTFALYGLLLFWIGAAELLKPFNPLLKFVLVKTVVFLTFWQGIGISMVCTWGMIAEPEDGKALQNLLICIEMLLASVSMLFAFPHKDFKMGGATHALRLGAISHAISIRDVINDTIHVMDDLKRVGQPSQLTPFGADAQFAPSYHDYVLYSDGGPDEKVKRKKYRGQKGEHPKASLMKNMDRGMLATVEEEVTGPGGRAMTPAKPNGTDSKVEKVMEKQRKTAILLDSDSDAMDSDDEDNQLGTMVEEDSAGSSDDERGRGGSVTRRAGNRLASSDDESPPPYSRTAGGRSRASMVSDDGESPSPPPRQQQRHQQEQRLPAQQLQGQQQRQQLRQRQEQLPAAGDDNNWAEGGGGWSDVGL